MSSTVEEQIERRRQRALEEITKVVNKGRHPLFSTFEVSSKSGQTYRVKVADMSRKRPAGTTVYLRHGEDITVQVGLPPTTAP